MAGDRDRGEAGDGDGDETPREGSGTLVVDIEREKEFLEALRFVYLFIFTNSGFTSRLEGARMWSLRLHARALVDGA